MTGPGTIPSPTQSRPGQRFNLLLSYAGWDADPWINHLPPLLEPLGIRSVLAGSGREATNVIRRDPVHVAVVDLGLPFDDAPEPDHHPTDTAGAAFPRSTSHRSPAQPEGGIRLLDLLQRLDCPPPTVVIKRRRSARDDRREIAAALRAGAFAVLDRPKQTTDLELMLQVLQRILQRHYANRWPDPT